MSWWTHQELKWYRTEIDAATHLTGVDATLTAGVILTESSGFTHAYRFEPQFWKRYGLATHPFYGQQNPHRWAASYGLMQILAVTARELGHTGIPEDLFQPACGLSFGCLQLRRCLDWAKQWQGNDKETLVSALAAYNGGRNGAQKPPSPQNSAYAQRVLAAIQAL